MFVPDLARLSTEQRQVLEITNRVQNSKIFDKEPVRVDSYDFGKNRREKLLSRIGLSEYIDITVRHPDHGSFGNFGTTSISRTLRELESDEVTRGQRIVSGYTFVEQIDEYGTQRAFIDALQLSISGDFLRFGREVYKGTEESLLLAQRVICAFSTKVSPIST